MMANTSSTSQTTLASSVELPCGLVLPNRLCKAAMTESLADPQSRATEALARLYRAWADGGCGLLITGNVMVDRRYPESAANLAIDGDQSEFQMERLRELATASQSGGCKCIVQLGHAGRQADNRVNLHVVGPSAIAMKNPDPRGPPKGASTEALTAEGVADVKRRFVAAAKVCEAAGFDGVQLHAAHGYLLSSFLNPRANQRTDAYGGSLENRARLLLEIAAETKAAVGEKFAVCVKINSSDFQRGGFSLEDCAEVVGMLDEAGVDLIEISGGNYESPVMLVTKSGEEVESAHAKGQNKSSVRREAFFLKFAGQVSAKAKRAKIMVTGGFRTRAGMDDALQSGDCDVVGVGRPLCLHPEVAGQLVSGEIDELPQYEHKLKLPMYLGVMRPFKLYKKLEFVSQQFHYSLSLQAIGHGEKLPKYAHIWGFFKFQKLVEEQAAALEGVDCTGTHTKPNFHKE